MGCLSWLANPPFTVELMLIGCLFKHPLPQPLCVCMRTRACVFYILSVSLCIVSAPKLPEPLMLAPDPRTKKKYRFVCVQGLMPWQLPNLWPTPPSNISVTHLLHFCGASPVALERHTHTHTHTHFRGGLRTESGRGILLNLACNLISMPQRHSGAVLSWLFTHPHVSFLACLSCLHPLNDS